MGILSGKYADDEGPDAEWARWLEENGGKLFVDADAAHAEILFRHAIARESEYHRPIIGGSLRDPDFANAVHPEPTGLTGKTTPKGTSHG